MSAKLRAKIERHEFTITTSASYDRVHQAGSLAAEGAKRTLQSSVREVGAQPGRIRYEIKGPGGLVRQMVLELVITEIPGGQGSQVALRVGDYLTMQSKVLGFIPVGPKGAPALKSLERFSARVRQELA